MGKLSDFSIMKGTLGYGKVAFTKAGLVQKYQVPTLIVDNNGMPLSEDQISTETTQPMVARVTWVPTIGDLAKWNVNSAGSFSDDLIMGMNLFYTGVRNKNSSLSAYDQKAVIKMIISAASLAAELGDLRRKFAIIDSCEGSEVNASKKGLWFEAANIVQNDIANVASNKSAYNNMVSLLKGLALPKSIEIIDRWYSLASCIIEDDPTIEKTQYIFPVLDGFWKLDTIPTSAHVGDLMLTSYNGSNMAITIKDLTSYINLLLLDQEWANILAEVKKACEGSELIYLGEEVSLDSKTELDIIQDIDFVDQLSNTVYLGQVMAHNDTHLKQYIVDDQTHTLYYKAEYNSSAIAEAIVLDVPSINLEYSQDVTGYRHIGFRNDGPAKWKFYCKSHRDFPDEGEVYFQTRNMAMPVLISALTNPVSGFAAFNVARGEATELYERFEILYFKSDGSGRVMEQSFTTFGFADQDVLHRQAQLSTFASAPQQYIILNADQVGHASAVWFPNDLDVFQSIPFESIEPMHKSIVGAAFIPGSLDNAGRTEDTKGTNGSTGNKSNGSRGRKSHDWKHTKKDKKDSKSGEDKEDPKKTKEDK